MGEPLFLTWFSHRRTTAIAARLNLELIELVSDRKGARRYLSLTARTIGLLSRRRPRILIVQNPSLVLALLALVLRPFLRYRLVVDAHNEAVEPYLHRSPVILRITDLLLRKANLTIVTNRQLARTVEACGGRAAILPDSLPTAPPVKVSDRTGEFQVTLISTFAADEPFANVVTAMQRLGPEFQLRVTGNPSKVAPELLARLSANVTLTGFLAEETYWDLLAGSDAVMDLTTMDNCLVCGAYEAICLGKPLLLSDSAASRELFAEFAEFADNTVEGIVAGMLRLRQRHAGLIAAAPAARVRFEENWQQHANRLRSYLSAPGATGVRNGTC